MSTTTVTDASRTAHREPGRRLLGGLNWLVVRQHRTALIALAAVAVLGAAWLIYHRARMAQLLEADGWPDKPLSQPTFASEGIGLTLTALGMLPVILAVFLGAPLIAADQEHGTARLVTTQSVSRRRWVTTKLAWCHGAVLVTAAVLSALFTWWWKPYRSVFPVQWSEGQIFDSTGPVLPALCLFLTAAGITIGLLLRRVLPAMAVTFVLSMVVELAWDRLRSSLAPARMFSYPLDGDLPARFEDSYELDRWIGSADGRLYGWGLCAEETEAASNACVKEHGIVDHVIKYLGFDQMPAMQWTGAGILLAATVVLTAFTVWWVSRRPLR